MIAHALPGLAATAGVMLLLWLLSLRLRDASIADLAWGPLVALPVAVAIAGPGALHDRGRLGAALVALWAARLAAHLVARNWGAGEDRRYRAMRERHGPRFAWVSLVTVFLFQGALAWVVALPAQAAALGPPTPLGWVDLAGAALFAAGLTLETLADRQLARFKADPASRGQVMDRGLWRWSRHPNYFGESLLWWGLGLLGVAAGAWWSLAGPAAITFMLLRVSGIALLEKDIADRRPGYRDYAARTSAFIPWPPRRG